MIKTKQTQLVLLYAIAELGGEATKSQVLEHIQNNGYWAKNDENDGTRPSRAEKTWRNDFSFERLHLVNSGHMTKREEKGWWLLTATGRTMLAQLIEQARDESSEKMAMINAAFLQKLNLLELYPEEAEDRILMESLAAETTEESATPSVLINEPLPKGEVARRAGNKPVYKRSPTVARAALRLAGHVCEVNPDHPSFTKRNTQHLYMEPHHFIPMAATDRFDVSLDREQNICCLCSNCHNQIHYGAPEDVRRLLDTLYHSRWQKLCAILGRPIELEEIYKIYNV